MNEDRIQHKGGCVSYRNTAPLTLFLYVDACHGRHRPTAITLHKQVDAGVRQTLWLCSAHAFDWLFRWCLFLLLCFSWHYKLVLMMCFGVLCWKVSPCCPGAKIIYCVPCLQVNLIFFRLVALVLLKAAVLSVPSSYFRIIYDFLGVLLS